MDIAKRTLNILKLILIYLVQGFNDDDKQQNKKQKNNAFRCFYLVQAKRVGPTYRKMTACKCKGQACHAKD